MKQLLLIAAIIMSVCVCAQEPTQKLTRKQKRYIKTAQQLDVLQYLPAQSDMNPATFWDSVTLNNKPLQEELERFNNLKGLAKSAVEKVSKAISNAFVMNASYSCSSNEAEVNETLHTILLGKDSKHTDITFRVNHDSELNAFCTPDGYIYINNGLFEALDGNFAMVNGVLAHELTHYLYKHALRHELNALKRQRKNSIAAALSVAAVGVANMYAAAGGAPVDTAAQKKSYQSIIDGAKEWTEAYYYRYGREEELESDIVAYRFLEWIGADPESYIKMLEIISGPWIGRETERYDDHPSVEDRIGVLRALPPALFRIKKE